MLLIYHLNGKKIILTLMMAVYIFVQQYSNIGSYCQNKQRPSGG